MIGLTDTDRLDQTVKEMTLEVKSSGVDIDSDPEAIHEALAAFYQANGINPDELDKVEGMMHDLVRADLIHHFTVEPRPEGQLITFGTLLAALENPVMKAAGTAYIIGYKMGQGAAGAS